MAKKGLFSWFKRKSDKHEEVVDNTVDTLELPEQELEHKPVTESLAEPTATTDDIIHVEVSNTKIEPLQEEIKEEDLAEDIESKEEIELSVTKPEKSPQVLEPQSPPEKKTSFFKRLTQGLRKTSESLSDGFLNILKGKKIDEDLFEELEEQLLLADLGINTTTKLIERLTEISSRKQLKDAQALYDLLREEMRLLLQDVEAPLTVDSTQGPMVILMVGVNGVGKTTTIGKMAKQFQQQGKSVMLAAGDTFRAAAVEQLQVWGERNDIPVVAQSTGSDSASVIYDAFQSAKSKNVDVLIADTAGRLQNKSHLMEELKKVVRVMKKLDANAPHEIMLTLDAGTGQNAISQAKIFNEAVGLTGITLTKLDGTAKGGVIFSIADQFKTPIRYIGVGEQIDDLQTFRSKDFIDALFKKVT